MDEAGDACLAQTPPALSLTVLTRTGPTFDTPQTRAALRRLLDPLPDGGVPVQSIVAGTNLAVSKDSKHHDEALELVEFLTSTEVQRKLNAGLESLPVLKSLVGAKEFSDPARTVFGEIQANHSEPMPLVPDEGAMETALGTTLVKLWPKAEAGTLTDADIRTALRDAEALMPRT